MEKEAFKCCIEDLQNAELDVQIIATDCHAGIAALCRKEYPHIDHQFDIWHVTKGVMKKLTKAGKQKGCTDILPGVKSVCNHLWWACQTCDGNPQVLKEKWLSVLHHTVNSHSWGGSDFFSECAHPPLPQDRSDRTCWLQPDTPSHNALKRIVLDGHLIKVLDQMTGFNHTGNLEVYHSVLLKYCEKRNHFLYEGMIARTELAALDNNHNLGRQQATTSMGMPRYRVAFPKGQKDWVAKPISEAKSYSYIANMMTRPARSHVEHVPKPAISSEGV